MYTIKLSRIFKVLIFSTLFATCLNIKADRLAIVADGNRKDSDDIGATSLSIAMIAMFEQQDKLVHFSHSCHLEPSEAGREKEHHESLYGAAAIWGGFNTDVFYNCRTQQNACVAQLTAQINASSSNDILWIIEAGEPDIIYYAMQAAEQSKRNFVRIVTHHPNNDVGVSYDLSDIKNMAGVNSGMVVRIPDQNNNLKKSLSTYYWMRDHSDARVNYLWERGLKAEQIGPSYIKGFFDPSDAGMTWYWLTGATDGGNKTVSVSEIKTKINEYTGYVLPKGKLKYSLLSKNFDSNGFYIDDYTGMELLAIQPNENEPVTASASYTFKGDSGKYDMYFHGVGENDGNSKFKVWINEVEVGSYTLSSSAQGWEMGVKFNKTFPEILINKGDNIKVEGTTATADGNEWSRARWLKIELYAQNVASTSDVWEEHNGYVIIEPEDVVKHEAGKWEVKNSVSGFAGNGYIEWTGGDFFGAPSSEHLSFKVKINNPGKYIFNWRNKVGAGNQTSEHNDTWLKIAGADDFYAQMDGIGTKYYPKGTGKTPNPDGTSANGWFKVYQYDKNLAWTWSTKTGDHQNGVIAADFNSQGEYQILVSGRSEHHLIDRITLAKQEVVAIAKNLGSPKSNLVGEDADTTEINVPKPTVSFDLPIMNAKFLSGENIYIVVQAKDSTASIAEIQLFIDNVYLRSEKLAPYEWGAADQNDKKLTQLSIGSHTLRVVVMNSNGVSNEQTITIHVKNALSVQNPKLKDIVAFPNPTKDKVILKGTEHIKSFMVFDINGKMQFSQADLNQKQIQLDMSGYTTGTYLIKLVTTSACKVIKLTKE